MISSKKQNCSGHLLEESVSPAKNNNANLGETCQQYWQRNTQDQFSSVVSKYNSEQIEKPAMVNCHCCRRDSNKLVEGKIVEWNVPTTYKLVKTLVGYASERIPVWNQCDKCRKFLSHLEEEQKTHLLGMCTDCFREKGDALWEKTPIS